MKLLNADSLIPAGDDGETMSYAALIAAVVNAVPKGIKVDEMRTRLSILDKCKVGDAEPEEMEFNSKETTMLRELVREFPWGVVDAGLVKFSDAIEAADK